jgi:hypothetical protein
MTDTLVTKVLLCKSRKDVVAYGVSVAPGVKLPVAEGFTGKQKLNEMSIAAKREVIVSAGAFQSPQLASFSSLPDSVTCSLVPAHGILLILGEPSQINSLISVAIWDRRFCTT